MVSNFRRAAHQEFADLPPGIAADEWEKVRAGIAARVRRTKGVVARGDVTHVQPTRQIFLVIHRRVHRGDDGFVFNDPMFLHRGQRRTGGIGIQSDNVADGTWVAAFRLVEI